MTKFMVVGIHYVVLSIFSINFTLGQRSFELDTSWPHESIANLTLHGSAVVLDGENNLLVLHRGSRFADPDRSEPITEAVVLVLDLVNGTVLRQWGQNFFHHPHGIEAASNGDIFITDQHLHQVFKFAYIPETRLWNYTAIITLGEPRVNGSGPSHFYDPTDVAIEPDTENFYVSDGYGNCRVVKFDRCGNYLFEFSAGTIDSTIPIIPFHIVHKVTVAIRHTPTANRALRRSVNNQDVVVAVADRNNHRIQFFSGNGSFLYEVTHEHLGIPQTWLMSVAHVDVNPREAPYNVNFDADFGMVYVSDFGSDTVPPRVHEVAVGWSNASVISRFSINASYPFVRRGSAHDLTVSENGQDVYVVSPNSNTLIVKRFRMKIESGANRNFYVSGMVMFVMVYLSITLHNGRT